MQVPRFKKFPSFLTVAIIGVLNSAASLYYYLRVMVYMYMKDPNEEFEWAASTPSIAICLAVAVGATLILGIVWSWRSRQCSFK